MAALAPGPRRAVRPRSSRSTRDFGSQHVRSAVELSRSNRLFQLAKGLLTDWVERGPAVDPSRHPTIRA